MPLSKTGNEQHTDARFHDIISYLGRPQLVKNFIYTGAVLRGNILQKVRIPDVLFNPLVRNKLDGFTSFRATAVFKLQLNAQPFQAGRLIMFAVPMPSMISPRDEWITKHISMTQALHNVQIDIAKQTEIELRVPFVSPFNSYDLINGLYPWADLYVMVYSTLNQVQGSDLECLLWAHFEDVELGAPTSGRMAIPKQQSGAPNEVSNAVALAARDKEGTGLLERVGSGAQKAYGVIGEKVGFLKPVMDVLSTFSKIGTSFFSGLMPFASLGFSKPLIHHAGTTVLPRPTQFFANTNGIDHSHVLALDALNCVDEYPTLGGTNLSETSFDFLKKIPQYIGNFCYGINSTYNTTLFGCLVSPNNRIPATVTAGADLPAGKVTWGSEQPTVLNYASSPFAYWTGSLVYTLRFVKTNFHSGRVEISYHPFVSSVDKTRMDYVYRLVVDLRDNSEVSFAVPYISPQPWKQLDHSYDPVFDYGDSKTSWPLVGSSTTGVLFVRALTPLICTSTIISNNIECVVEVRAGDDYKVQAPVRSHWFPVGFKSTATWPWPTQQSGGVVALPGTFETRTNAIEGANPPSITGNDQDVNRQDTTKYCAGEAFEDYRSFIKRFSFIEHIRIKAEQSNFVSLRNVVDYLRTPILNFIQYTTGKPADGDGIKIRLQYAPSPLTFVGGMYAFYRGSFRLKTYIPNNPALMCCQLVYGPDYDVKSTTIIKANDEIPLTLYNYLAPAAFEQPESKKFAEFQIPYYSPTIVTVPWSRTKEGTLFTQPLPALMLSSTATVASTTADIDTFVSVAAADDFSFHMFIGIPFCFQMNTIISRGTTTGGLGQGPQLVDVSTLSVNPCQPIVDVVSEPDWKVPPQAFTGTYAPSNIVVTDKTLGGTADAPTVKCSPVSTMINRVVYLPRSQVSDARQEDGASNGYIIE